MCLAVTSLAVIDGSTFPNMAAETPYGFIGLGIMGRGMALNLLKKGFKVVVWNRSVDKCDELVKGQE